MTTATREKPATLDIRVLTIMGDKLQDDLMHHFDLFEPCKRLAVPRVLRMTISENADLQKIIDCLRATSDQQRMFIVAAVVLGTKVGFVDESVKLVSNGEGFCALDDMLLAYGFDREAQ